MISGIVFKHSKMQKIGMAVAFPGRLPRTHHRRGGNQEAPRKLPGGTQEASRTLPGGTQQAPRRHPEEPRAPQRLQEVLEAIIDTTLS